MFDAAEKFIADLLISDKFARFLESQVFDGFCENKFKAQGPGKKPSSDTFKTSRPESKDKKEKRQSQPREERSALAQSAPVASKEEVLILFLYFYFYFYTSRFKSFNVLRFTSFPTFLLLFLFPLTPFFFILVFSPIFYPLKISNLFLSFVPPLFPFLFSLFYFISKDLCS